MTCLCNDIQIKNFPLIELGTWTGPITLNLFKDISKHKKDNTNITINKTEFKIVRSNINKFLLKNEKEWTKIIALWNIMGLYIGNKTELTKRWDKLRPLLVKILNSDKTRLDKTLLGSDFWNDDVIYELLTILQYITLVEYKNTTIKIKSY